MLQAWLPSSHPVCAAPPTSVTQQLNALAEQHTAIRRGKPRSSAKFQLTSLSLENGHALLPQSCQLAPTGAQPSFTSSASCSLCISEAKLDAGTCVAAVFSTEISNGLQFAYAPASQRGRRHKTWLASMYGSAWTGDLPTSLGAVG